MSDNKILLIVPRFKIANHPFSNMYPKVRKWLDDNVAQQGGSWAWFNSHTVSGIEYVSFSFERVPNSIRSEFVKTFSGKLKYPAREKLFKKHNAGFIVSVPSKNLVAEGTHCLTDDAVLWLEVNVKESGGFFQWSTGITQDDIVYTSMILGNVDEEIALLFKLTFG